MRKLYFALIVFILAGANNGFCQTATYTCNSTSQGTGSIQTFTVPACVDTITIEAFGAQGGNGGGLGAEMVGTFAVTPGEVLNILVGQAGTVNGDGGSGGGGSFVTDVANTAWIVAGGGGGTSGTGSAGDPGLTTTAAGNAGHDGGTGGSGGGGGGGGVDNASCTSGDGGGGFCGNGGGSSNGGAVGAGGVGCVNGGDATGAPLCAGGGQSYLNGGAGGIGCTGGGGCSNIAISGGYGGGGGACGSGGGGGGGYSGGGGGGYSFLNGGEGGGGGSYNNGINQINTAGVQSGNGQVIITWKTNSATATINPVTDPSCFGGNNGSATVTGTGGAPYTYAWSTAPVQTTQTATGLSAGTYTATITDALGCSAKDSVTITQPVPLRDSIVSFTNVSVACGSNGTATVGVKGTGPFTYSWNNGQTTSTASNLAAGTYTVHVTSTAGCTTKDSITISQPPSLTATIPTSVNDLCNGGNNGSATVSITGGNAPYTYSWNNGETSAKDSLLTAGTYTISVTDANGCTVKANVTITQPAAVRDSIATFANVLCNGGNTGTATVGVKDGTSPYTYTWTNAQTTPTATGLTAGSYSVVVKDANGCKDSTNLTITQPAVLKLTAAAFATSCSGNCDGSANVIPAGGTSPYKYAWSNASTTANDNNLCAGTYSVIITDANGCTHDTIGLTVTQPPAITMTINSTSADCNQADGTASVNVAGGTPPYLYLWSTGATTTNLTNVKPGTYCVGVQDAHNCKDTVCVVVPNTPGEKATIATSTNVSCNGGANGSITGSAAGGTGPYTYSWSTAPVQTTQTASGVPAGTYTLTVTDATGCQDTAIATITEPAPIAITVTGNTQLCIGKSDILSAAATGGTGPYTFTWDATTVGTTYTVSPTISTSYTVIATDANGCKSTATIIPVKVRDSIKVTVKPVTPMCQGDTGVLAVTASGGDSTYTYSWAPGGSTSSTLKVSPTSSTVYTVTVSDGCSPTSTGTVLVNLFPSRPISFTADSLTGCQALCINFVDSVAGVLKTITWNFGDGGTANITNPTHCYSAPGVYTVELTVTNDSGCVVSKTKPNMITVYPDPKANFSWTPQYPTNIDPTIGFIGSETDTTSKIISWVWSFGDKTDSTSFTQNTIHTYGDTGVYCPQLIVTDMHGCHDTIDHCIDIKPQFTIYIPNAFTPNGDGLNDVFLPKGDYIENFEMYVFDRWGEQIYHTTNINQGWDGTMHGNKVQEDTYVYLITCTDPENNKQYSYTGRVTVVR